MPYSAPLELLTDAAGSVTFGWIDQGVFYARFSHCLSARLGEVFSVRLSAALETASTIKYFADARALESYDLLARSAFMRVVSEHRQRFEQITLLAWSGGEITDALLNSFGTDALVTQDPQRFEDVLFAAAPRAGHKLGAKADAAPRPRWPLRR